MTPLQPETPKVPLADQPWFVDLLAGKGFYRSSPTTLTNGKASIQVEGTKFLADPGTGDKAWNSDLAEADPDTIKLILQQILKTPPFLTEADLTQERADKQRIERALNGIAATIKERWDREQPDTEALDKLDDAERIISGLVQRTLPSRAHTELVDLLSRFAVVNREIRAQEPTK